jgi:hypothetical protein
LKLVHVILENIGTVLNRIAVAKKHVDEQ